MYLLVTKYNLHISVTPKNGGETDIEVSLVKKKGEKFKYQSRKQHDTGSLRSTQKKLSHWRIKERRASSKEENWYNFISSLAPIEHVLVPGLELASKASKETGRRKQERRQRSVSTGQPLLITKERRRNPCAAEIGQVWRRLAAAIVRKSTSPSSVQRIELLQPLV